MTTSSGPSPPLEFSRKAEGVILQFCGNVPPALALKILAAVANARLSGNTHALISEEALHSYLTEVTDSEVALSAMEKALSLPVGKSWEEFHEECIQNKSVITARIILERQKRYIGGMGTIEWVGFATQLLSYSTRLIPSNHRDFDLMAAWFFDLDLIQDSRWITTKKGEGKVHNLQKQLQGYANNSTTSQITTLLTSKSKVGLPSSSPSPRMQLAARGCLIFLDRILNAKKANDKNNPHQGPPISFDKSDFPEDVLLEKSTSRKDKEVMDAVDKLLLLKNDGAFSGFENYFNEVENFLSPLCDLPHFKSILVQNLLPIAPYLQYL